MKKVILVFGVALALLNVQIPSQAFDWNPSSWIPSGGGGGGGNSSPVSIPQAAQYPAEIINAVNQYLPGTDMTDLSLPTVANVEAQVVNKVSTNAWTTAPQLTTIYNQITNTTTLNSNNMTQLDLALKQATDLNAQLQSNVKISNAAYRHIVVGSDNALADTNAMYKNGVSYVATVDGQVKKLASGGANQLVIMQQFVATAHTVYNGMQKVNEIPAATDSARQSIKKNNIALTDVTENFSDDEYATIKEEVTNTIKQGKSDITSWQTPLKEAKDALDTAKQMAIDAKNGNINAMVATAQNRFNAIQMQVTGIQNQLDTLEHNAQITDLEYQGVDKMSGVSAAIFHSEDTQSGGVQLSSWSQQFFQKLAVAGNKMGLKKALHYVNYLVTAQTEIDKYSSYAINEAAKEMHVPIQVNLQEIRNQMVQYIIQSGLIQAASTGNLNTVASEQFVSNQQTYVYAAKCQISKRSNQGKTNSKLATTPQCAAFYKYCESNAENAYGCVSLAS